jgi:hypothetical protein
VLECPRAAAPRGVLAEVLARGFERTSVGPERERVRKTGAEGNETSMMAALPEKSSGSQERGDWDQPAV